MRRAAALTALIVSLVAATASAAPAGRQAVRGPLPDVTPGTVCNDVPHLGYPPTGGGPLIQHVKVVDVFYSPGFKYKAMLESFYQAVTQSAYFDWLVEYNVASYKIGRGSFVSSFEDTNVNPTTVTQVNPQTYLQGLLTANKLPPPDDDTMYMIYFPSGVDPTDGNGGGSCISNGNYCAYHNSFTTAAGKLVRYGVIPDMEAGKCVMGCGPPGFASFTDVSSHELIEAVTDPDGTGWYDDAVAASSPNNCGEIGDICAVGGTAETGTIMGFIVQNEWSNKNKKCISVDPNVVLNDFTLAVAPGDFSIPAGGSATVTVTLTKKSGVAEPVSLTAPTPPTGLTASFAPASVSSDAGTSTLTIASDPSLTPGAALTLTVKAAGSASHTATLNVTIVDAPDLAMGGAGGAGGSGGNGQHGGGGCSVAGDSIAGSWAAAALLLVALAFRRRRV